MKFGTDELDLNDLDKVLAGNDRDVATEQALNTPNLYRQEKIEELKKEREALKKLDREISQEELDKVLAGRDPKVVESEQPVRKI